MVDDRRAHVCPLQRDIHWDTEDIELPHTEASQGLKDRPMMHSADNIVYVYAWS
jgi:hypothetical protein